MEQLQRNILGQQDNFLKVHDSESTAAIIRIERIHGGGVIEGAMWGYMGQERSRNTASEFEVSRGLMESDRYTGVWGNDASLLSSDWGQFIRGSFCS